MKDLGELLGEEDGRPKTPAPMMRIEAGGGRWDVELWVRLVREVIMLIW